MNFNKIFILFCVCIIMLFNNCGIYSFSGSSIPKNATTIYVKPIVNNSNLASPELPQLLTDKMNNYILSQTKLKIHDQNPDLYFSGKITKYHTAPISINSQDNASQNRLTVEIEVSYESSLNPEHNFVKKISNYVDFNSSENFIDVESELNTLIIDKLVEDIFYSSFANW